MNLNKVFIYGNLTKDVELRQTQSGQMVASFSVATNRSWKSKDGDKQEETQFHNIVAWGKTAELIAQYMSKGSSIFIEGRLQTRSYESKDGSKRYVTEIVVENMQFGPKKSNNSGLEQESEPSDRPDQGAEIPSEDLPF